MFPHFLLDSWVGVPRDHSYFPSNYIIPAARRREVDPYTPREWLDRQNLIREADAERVVGEHLDIVREVAEEVEQQNAVNDYLGVTDQPAVVSSGAMPKVATVSMVDAAQAAVPLSLDGAAQLTPHLAEAVRLRHTLEFKRNQMARAMQVTGLRGAQGLVSRCLAFMRKCRKPYYSVGMVVGRVNRVLARAVAQEYMRCRREMLSVREYHFAEMTDIGPREPNTVNEAGEVVPGKLTCLMHVFIPWSEAPDVDVMKDHDGVPLMYLAPDFLFGITLDTEVSYAPWMATAFQAITRPRNRRFGARAVWSDKEDCHKALAVMFRAVAVIAILCCVISSSRRRGGGRRRRRFKAKYRRRFGRRRSFKRRWGRRMFKKRVYRRWRRAGGKRSYFRRRRYGSYRRYGGYRRYGARRYGGYRRYGYGGGGYRRYGGYRRRGYRRF